MSKEKTGGHWKNRRRAIIGMHDTYKLQMVVEDQIMSKSSEWITDRLPTKQEAVSGNVICCRWGHINLLQSFTFHKGSIMNIGIEFTTTRSADGKTYWRVAPYLSASYRQKLYIVGVGLIALLAITLSALAVAETPDPIIKPEQTVTLWGAR